MTRKQFYKEVRALDVKWVYRKYGYFRCQKWYKGDCPLVALQRAWGLPTAWSFVGASKNLGLRMSVAKDISAMADGRRPPSPEFLHALRLRKKDLKK